MNDPLHHFSPDEIREQLAGFPDGAIDAALQLKESPTAEALKRAVLLLLEFYLPAGSEVKMLELSAESRLREDVGIDSLTFAEAAFKLEELFDLRIENEELAELATVGDLSGFLQKKIGGAADDG